MRITGRIIALTAQIHLYVRIDIHIYTIKGVESDAIYLRDIRVIFLRILSTSRPPEIAHFLVVFTPLKKRHTPYFI